MGEHSSIEWTDHTFNPWWGCTRVSPACDHCYAETFAHRLGMNLWGEAADRRPMSDSYWRQPLKWNAKAAAAGLRQRVFCASMADVFEHGEQLDPHRARLWELIAATPYLDWLLLTKRPQNILRMVPWRGAWPPNVWVGTTVENQDMAAKRLKHLVRVPAVVRFVSCEPLLGPLDLYRYLEAGAIHWVIAGGESGHGARASAPDAFRWLRDQCQHHRVPFLFKQWGDWAPGADDSPLLTPPMVRFGKHAAGRELDGTTWTQFPVPAAETEAS